MSQTNILLESGTNELEVVEFYIEEQLPDGRVYTGHYGVNVAKVLEIIRKPQVTEMPNAPHPCVLGAFNLRSRIIPLVDLSLWLGKKMVPAQDQKVVVTEFNNVINGFLVSGVNRIHRISWEQVEAPDVNLTMFSGYSVTGIVKFGDRIVLLLDMEKIIGDLNPNLALTLDDGRDLSGIADRQYHALIADDSSMIRRTLSRGLEEAGFKVTVVNDGKSAWDLLSSTKSRLDAAGRPIWDEFDIIISDIEMPVMDGHNLTKRIKDDQTLRPLPVILFSSLITDRLRHKGEAVGADEQISKPNLVTLAETAVQLIQQRRPRS